MLNVALLTATLFGSAAGHASYLNTAKCDQSWAVGDPKFMSNSLAGNFIAATTTAIVDFPSTFEANTDYEFTVNAIGKLFFKL